MTHDATLTEAKLYSSYWDDGLLDLLCGLVLMIAGVGWVIGLGSLAMIQAPLWVVLWSPLRRSLVEPRAGFVEFSKARRQRAELGLVQALGLGIAMLTLVALVVFSVRSGRLHFGYSDYVAGLPAALISVPAVLVALLTGARRFYVFALILLVGAAVTGAAGWSPAIPIIVTGTVVTVSGAILLVRFIHASRHYQNPS